MDRIRINSACFVCLLKKYVDFTPDSADETLKLKYIQSILEIMSKASVYTSAPELVEQIDKYTMEVLGTKKDYKPIKKYFNELVLSLEQDVLSKIEKSEDRLVLALKFAMTGNYIDFGAFDNVDSQKLLEFVSKAEDIKIDEDEICSFKNDLSNGKSLVYLIDNCGEIVFDKLFIKTIKSAYPNIKVTAVVRGDDVLNDATLEDAEQVNLSECADVVISNGTAIAGTCLERISEQALSAVEGADVIISKGQGNFETLCGCGKNVYYIFMCKCDTFTERFGVKKLSGIFINDKKLV